MSQYHQTSGLEAKHSLDNAFAPKDTYYPYHSLCARFVSHANAVICVICDTIHMTMTAACLYFLTCRIFCSNLHYNENAQRRQAQTIDGQLRWSIVYPKAYKGEKAVARPLKEKPSYGTLLNYIYIFASFALKRNAIHWKLSAHPHSLH